MKNQLLKSLLSLIFFFSILIVTKAMPSGITYQGTLNDSTGNPVSTSIQLDFLFNDLQGVDNANITCNIIPNDLGYFNVILGDSSLESRCGANDLTVLDYTHTYEMLISVNSTQMSPGVPVSSVFYAQNSDILDGLDSTDFIQTETDPEFDTKFSGKTTDDLAEGIVNKYFPGLGGSSIGDLQDVDVTGVQDNDLLTYNSGTWEVVAGNVTNWNTAYGWSNHTLAGYLTSVDKDDLNNVGTLSFDWQVNEGGTGIGTYAAGDLIYASGANTLSALSVGSNGEILTLSGGLPSWQAAPAGPPSGTSGQTLRYNTSWEVTSNLYNDGTDVGIGTQAPSTMLQVAGRIMTDDPTTFSSKAMWNTFEHDPAKMLHRLGVDAGWRHSCALLNNGNITCWGYNIDGQAADYTGGDAIGVGTGDSHSCALLDNGNVTCWGLNSSGQSAPYVGGDVIGINLGRAHTCALQYNGNIDCWGNNSAGRSDDYTGGDAVGIDAGAMHSCALLNNGNIDCWGNNIDGQAADYTGGDAIEVITGDYNSCALLNNGNIICWGGNSEGQSADYVGGDAIGVNGGGHYTCALLNNGNIDCWGANLFGQSADYSGGDAIGIGAGVYHNCVLLSDGNIDCWGWNQDGQAADYTGRNARNPFDPLQPYN